MTDVTSSVLDSYRARADILIARYESLSSDALYRHVREFIPALPCRTIDIGAGTGRDARMFNEMGHDVTAVEPVDVFARAGQRHSPSAITWLSDTLPALASVRALATKFDFVNINAVWHHLGEDDRAPAFSNLAKIAARNATLILSLRNGPTFPDRPVFDITASETIELAQANGFRLLAEHKADAVQPENRAHGVAFTWLVFQFDRASAT